MSPKAMKCADKCEKFLTPDALAELLQNAAVYIDESGRETAAGVMLAAARFLRKRN